MYFWRILLPSLFINERMSGGLRTIKEPISIIGGDIGGSKKDVS
jgi:hypothetical protein